MFVVHMQVEIIFLPSMLWLKADAQPGELFVGIHLYICYANVMELPWGKGEYVRAYEAKERLNEQFLKIFFSNEWTNIINK